MLKVIKNQKYQTVKQVERAAKRGKKAAIHSSIRHWRELTTAPLRDLTDKVIHFSINECSLCELVNNCCNKCLLHKELGQECYATGELYTIAHDLMEDIRSSCTLGKACRDKLVKRYRRAAEKMLRFLESLL